MISIRTLTPRDEPALWEMCYHALYVPEGHPPYPPDIIYQPEISRYVAGWGRPGDQGVVAFSDTMSTGAAWLRLLTGTERGYAYVDDMTPELSIAVLPEYRGKGIGSQLLTRLLGNAKSHFSGICLSVHVDNPARHLYQRFGFEAVKEESSSVVILKRWE